MPYIPKSQYTVKHTNGSELFDPASGEEYIGEYIQYGQKYFAGNTILNLKVPLKKIPEGDDTIARDTRTFLYNQLNKKQYKKLKDRFIPIGTKPTPTEIIITIIPIAIARTPIFIIGADILFLCGLALKILFDKKCSKFKIPFYL